MATKNTALCKITTDETTTPTGERGLLITCSGGCRKHDQPTSAVMRHPGHTPDYERLYHFLHIAHHPFLSRAQSTQKFGPWAV